MKTKYLLSTLLGGVMLSACSVEDEFNSAQIAQKDSSAPVFTVTLDEGNNPLTRADLNGKWQLGFAKGDLMSLFYSLDEGLLGTKSAIYEATGEGDGALTFTTKSLVEEGEAIMMFPADTTFAQRDSEKGLSITVDPNQNANTKKLTPYMSEFISIGDRVNSNNKVTGNGAGYGKTYDIALKRVASTLSLTLNLTDKNVIPSEVDDLGVEKVELGSENATFTNTIFITRGEKDPVAKTDKVHTTWVKQSELDTKGTVTGVKAITTTDVANNVATFTLLPVAENEDGTVKNAVAKGYVKVYTNYGYVNLQTEGTNGAKIWHKTTNPKQDLTTLDGLKAILTNAVLWAPTAVEESPFYSINNNDELTGENVGGHISRTVDASLKSLNMDGLHIKNEAHLLKALALYNAKTGDSETKVPAITFALVGKTFELTKTGWEALMAQASSKINPVNFIACKGGDGYTKCEVIKLTNNTGGEVEVPELQLNGENGNTAVEVQLAKGNWSYKSVEQTDKVNAKQFKGFNTLTVNSDATLALKDYIAKNGDSSLTLIKNNGNVKVDGTAFLEVNMTNFKNIEIQGDLRVKGAVELINSEATGNVNGWAEGAKIDVYGSLGIVSDKSGVITNYGIVRQAKKGASILVTVNADIENGNKGVITSEFGNKQGTLKEDGNKKTLNRIGTIELAEGTPSNGINNVYVKNENATGFIKVFIDNMTTAPVEKDYGVVANYAVITNCSAVTFGKSADGKTTYMPENIKYVEVNNANAEMVFTTPANTKAEAPYDIVTGLFVRNATKVNIPRGSSLKVSYTYIHDSKSARIGHAGHFDKGVITGGYFGGATADGDNIISFE